MNTTPPALTFSSNSTALLMQPSMSHNHHSSSSSTNHNNNIIEKRKWRDQVSLDIRKSMQIRILETLKSLRPDAPTSIVKELESTVTRLEAHLFMTSCNWEEYDLPPQELLKALARIRLKRNRVALPLTIRQQKKLVTIFEKWNNSGYHQVSQADLVKIARVGPRSIREFHCKCSGIFPIESDNEEQQQRRKILEILDIITEFRATIAKLQQRCCLNNTTTTQSSNNTAATNNASKRRIKRLPKSTSRNALPMTSSYLSHVLPKTTMTTVPPVPTMMVQPPMSSSSSLLGSQILSGNNTTPSVGVPPPIVANSSFMIQSSPISDSDFIKVKYWQLHAEQERKKKLQQSKP